MIGSSPFGFTVETRPGKTIVRLCGDLDMASVAQCEERFRAIQLDAEALIVDLRGLTFLDSMGLSVLLGAHCGAQDQGGSVALIQGNRTIHRVFQITDTHTRVNWVSPEASDLGPC